MTVLRGARVVTPTGVVDGWVQVSEARIAAVGAGPPREAPAGSGARPIVDTLDLGGDWLVPGFVDLHVHGGGGHDLTGSPAELAGAVAFHRRHGTTRTLVSLMAAPVDVLCEQLGWVAAAMQSDERVVGAHLEGPFLAAARCGAQNAAHLLEPDAPVLHKLLDAGQGALRTITLAPELPGAVDLVSEVVATGVVAAVGHTDATYEQARAAFGAGASLVTHLFNGMSAVSHRAPGTAVAALDADPVVELIADGVHVHPAVSRLVARCAPGRVALVTDAISAAGAADGAYRLGDQAVTVVDGQARLHANGRLAGSTLTMDAALRHAVHDVGLSIVDAVRAASTTPAGVLGIADRCGAIAPGLDADLVRLSPDLQVRAVMTGGHWLS